MFIVRNGARSLVRFEGFDFLLGGVKTHHRTAVVMASVYKILDCCEGKIPHYHLTLKMSTWQNILKIVFTILQ